MKPSNEVRWAGRVYREANLNEGADLDGGAAAGGGGDDIGGDGGGDDSGADNGAAAADNSGAGDGADAGAGEDPGDWRSRLTEYVPEGERESAAKLMGRFTTEEDFVKGAVQAHAKLRAGEIQTVDVSNMSEDQLAEYREAQGIPTDGKYEVNLPDDVKMQEGDEAMIEQVMPIALAGNVPTPVFNAMVEAQLRGRDALLDQMVAQDGIDRQTFETVARENWGADFEVNMNRLTNMMNMLPESVRDDFQDARLANGKGLMNSPEVVNFLVSLDRQIHPLDTLPGEGFNQNATAQEIEREVEAIFAAGEQKEKYYGTELEKRYEQAIAVQQRASS